MAEENSKSLNIYIYLYMDSGNQLIKGDNVDDNAT